MSVLITGMHRSGTSAVARVVEGLGLVPGGPLMAPAADNPRGFFERVDVMRLNDRWLEHFGGNWWAPPIIGPSGWSGIDPDQVAADRARLDLLAPGHPPWFVKDPRLALLLPLWDRLALRVLPLVLCVRDPRDVAASLQARDGIHPRRGLALWATYLHRALRASTDRPLLILDYDRLLDDPVPAVEALAGFCAAPVAVDIAGLASLVEPDLRHHPEGPLGVASEEVDGLMEIHRRLAAAHGRTAQGSPDSALPPPWVADVLEELAEVHRLHREVALARSAGSNAAAAAEGETDRVRRELLEQVRQARREALEQRTALLGRLDGYREEADRARARAEDVGRERDLLRSDLVVLQAEVESLRSYRSRAQALDSAARHLTGQLLALRADLARLAAEREAERDGLLDRVRTLEQRARELGDVAARASDELAAARAQGAVEALAHARLAAALEDAILEGQRAVGQLALLRGSRSYRFGRRLTAPGRAMRGPGEPS